MTEISEPSATQATPPFVPSTYPFDFNKAAIFTALEAAGITEITVTFDGYGDSGQIEDISASIGETPAPMPDCMIETLGIVWPQTEPALSSISLATAVENLAYDVLAQTHCGWENNDGAYGDIVFDAAARTITLDYNERYTESENFTHTL
jgi:hypothetical protein